MARRSWGSCVKRTWSWVPGADGCGGLQEAAGCIAESGVVLKPGGSQVCRGAMAVGPQSPLAAQFVGMDNAGGVRGVMSVGGRRGAGVFLWVRLRLTPGNTPGTEGKLSFTLVYKTGEGQCCAGTHVG